MQVHGYPYDAHGSTFIVEMHDDVWRAGRLRRVRRRGEFAPGESDEKSIEPDRGDVRRRARRPPRCTANNSKWMQLHDGPQPRAGGTGTSCCSATLRTPRTSRSGRARSWRWRTPSPSPRACTSSPRCRRRWTPTRLSAGRWCSRRSAPLRPAWSGSRTSASTSTRSPPQFAFNILTRSRRITYDNLRMRDPEFVEALDRRFAEQEVRRGHADTVEPVPPPMFQPYRIGRPGLANRVVVSPMDMYSRRRRRPRRLPPGPPRRARRSAVPDW